MLPRNSQVSALTICKSVTISHLFIMLLGIDSISMGAGKTTEIFYLPSSSHPSSYIVICCLIRLLRREGRTHALLQNKLYKAGNLIANE
jgi:hypothetical protein